MSAPFGIWPPVAAPDSDDIPNRSSVPGATVTDALNSLLASVAINTAALAAKAARNPFWDAPTVAGPYDEEFNADPLVTQAVWTIRVAGAIATPMVRDGNVDLSQSIATGHFRSRSVGGVLLVQLRQNEEIMMWKNIAVAPTSQLLWFAGVGFQNEANANATDPRCSLQINKDDGGGRPSFADRALIRTGSGPDRYEGVTVTGGGIVMNVATGTFQLMPVQGLALRINHASAAAGNVGCFGFAPNGTIATVLNGNGQQFNAANQKVTFNLLANTSQPPVNGVNAAIFAIHFLRTVDLNAGGWLAQS